MHDVMDVVFEEDASQGDSWVFSGKYDSDAAPGRKCD